MPTFIGAKRSKAVLRVDGFYLYQTGWQIHPLSNFAAGNTTYEQAIYPLYFAESALDGLVAKSVFRLRTSVKSGQELLAAVRALKSKIDESRERGEDQKQVALDWFDVYAISSNLSTFEAVLGAELSLVPLYVVTPKAGYDMPTLIESGSLCFPQDVVMKIPEALKDLGEGTRCIAFELFTAAGFHLHRANESVLRRYWDAVTNGAPRPTSRNMGDYLNAMNQKGVGDAKVKAALKDLKDLHRNPLTHPDDSIDNIDEAVALMNGIHTVIVHMLRAIPHAVPPSPPTVGAIPPPSLLPP